MRIQILGTGCPKCRKLAETASEAATQLGLTFEVEKITEIDRIADFGVMTTPGLAVDGKVLSAGRALSVEEAKTLLSNVS